MPPVFAHGRLRLYLLKLLDAIPDIHMSGRARTPVQGEVPNPLNPPTGCPFHPRCPHAMEICTQQMPGFSYPDENHRVACWLIGEGQHG